MERWLGSSEMKLLLAIKPEYANAILEGTKKYEFRRRTWRRHVDSVLMYATMPVGKVLGEFKIQNILYDKLESIWLQTKDGAGIIIDEFHRYFRGCEYGYAVKIGRIVKYEEPLKLSFFNMKPPQSFKYVKTISDYPVEQQKEILEKMAKSFTLMLVNGIASKEEKP